MATTDEDVVISGKDTTTVLIGASTAFIIQNTKNTALKYKISGSTVEGGNIDPYDTREFNYDIDIWNPNGKATDDPFNIYLVRS